MTSNNPTKEQIEAQKQELLKAWEEAIKADAAQYGNGYAKAEYTFTRSEHKQLAQQNTIKAIADNAVNDLLNIYVLPRVGIVPTAETKITYDLSVGRLVVWTPKKTSEKAYNSLKKQ